MPVKIVALGGCAIQRPLRTVAARGLIDINVFRRVGFRRMPSAFTPRALIQMIDFCSGALDIPADVKRFCFIDPVEAPDAAGASRLREADMALVELVSPNDILFRGFALNPNYIIFDVARLRTRDPALAHCLHRWLNAGLWKRNEAVRAQEAQTVRDNLKIEEAADELLLEMLEEARGVLFSEAEIEECLRTVERRLNMPIALALHIPRYMPDGRPISWPPGFLSTMHAVSARLDWPTFDPGPVVAAYGPDRALAPPTQIDGFLTHYAPAFDHVMGEALHEFIRSATGLGGAAPR